MLQRWARLVVRLRWVVAAGWLLAAAGFVALDVAIPPDFADRFDIPGTETSKAQDVLRNRFPVEARNNATLVIYAEAGIRDPGARAAIDILLAQLRQLPGIALAAGPADPGSLVSPDGRTALTTIQFDDAGERVPLEIIDRLVRTTMAASGPAARFELSGPVIQHYEREGPGESEVIGVAAAVVVLVLAFGSLVAAGLPVITALVGLACGLSVTALLTHTIAIPSVAPSFASMLGIGVGIDYALFVATRYREALAEGASVPRAVEVALTTAGKAVAIAGMAVVIALLGLMLVGIPIIGSLGLVAATMVAIAVLVALTLIPALLAIAGRRIDRFRVFRRRGTHDLTRSPLYRFSRLVQAHPYLAIGLMVVALGALAFPATSMELGFADAGHSPTSTTSRRAYDLQAAAFGPGFNGTLLVVVEEEGGLGADTLLRLRKAIAGTGGVVAVGPPRVNAERDTAVMTAVPATSPQSGATRDLVERLRAEVFPGLLPRAAPDAAVYLTGPTAASIDMSARMESRLVVFFAAVVGLSMVLLALAFRSLTIPVKAAALNFVAIAAALGIAVAVFQWGWAGRLVGIDRTGPIEAYLPMFVFAVLFGLSMDYEVFLVSRIRERYLENRDPGDAIAFGVAASGRVISAAAAILVVVFGSFILGDQRTIKEFGLTLAVAIFIDATAVRLVLVPAVMELLGHASWALPAWLNDILPWWDMERPPEDRRALVGAGTYETYEMGPGGGS